MMHGLREKQAKRSMAFIRSDPDANCHATVSLEIDSNENVLDYLRIDVDPTWHISLWLRHEVQWKNVYLMMMRVMMMMQELLLTKVDEVTVVMVAVMMKQFPFLFDWHDEKHVGMLEYLILMSLDYSMKFVY